MFFGYTLPEFMFNMVFYAEFCVFLNVVLTPRYKRRWMLLIYPAMILSIFLFIELFQKMSIFRALAIPVMIMLYSLFLYRDALVRRFFSAWLVFALVCLTELMTIGLLYNPYMLAGGISLAPVAEQYLCWGTEIVIAALLYWVASIVMNRVRNRFSLREMMMYIFFPVSQCILMYGWLHAAWENGWNTGQQTLLLAVSLICLVADIGLFASMFRVSRQIELERDNRLLSAKIEAQHMHYEELTEQYETIRRMRHDIDKHVNVLDMLIASSDAEQAAQYAAELTAEYECGTGITERELQP